MATIESISKAYIDFVLSESAQPGSVKIFTDKNMIAEEEFYHFFGSFEAVEQKIWTDFAVKTLSEIKSQEFWGHYNARDKALSFFYNFFEILESRREFVLYCVNKQSKNIFDSHIFEGVKAIFEDFCNKLIIEGIASNELSDRKLFSNRYKDALWVQLIFVLNFWINDKSVGYEKTNLALEKSIDVTFGLFQRAPIDNLFEYGKFLAKNGGIKENIHFGSN